MNKNESKYFNTAIKMDEALLAILEKRTFHTLQSKKYATLPASTAPPSISITKTRPTY